MFNTAKPALITGGCGFVGRHLTRRLLAEGYDLWIVDDCSTGLHPDEWLTHTGEREEILPGVVRYHGDTTVVFVHGDARDFFTSSIPLGAIEAPAFGDVFHFAAVVGGRATIDGNPMAVAIDLALDALCFNWAVSRRPDRLLYASSSAAYPVDLQGENGAVALKESDIQFGGRLGQPDMTYGWSKLTGEYLARIAHGHYGLHTASVRPFSGYGEEQDLTYPVPSIALRAARGDNPLTVWGSGLQGRDFVHIDDCVEAMLRTLDRVQDGSGVNIGSGTLTNFREVAALFARIEGYDATVQPMEDKPVGVHSRFADVSLMQEVLDWSPRISLEEGFTRVLTVAHARLAAGLGDSH
ncbi:MAG: NAD-dependent epimerase/dehydratase family protein [Acidimicrobiales bacterium]